MGAEPLSAFMAGLFLIWFVCLAFPPACICQFITHFNSRGLKGNITFDIKDEKGLNPELVIESIIQIDSSISSIYSKEFEEETEVKFEWKIYSNSLNHLGRITCSNDDLGQIVTEQNVKDLYENREIILNKFNQWIIPMNDTKNLSHLIWGKSILLSLSKTHSSPAAKEIDSTSKLSAIRTSDSSSAVKPARISPIAIPDAANKPTFAPRVRPSIQQKMRTVSIAPSLPKPQSLVFETNVTSGSSGETDTKSLTMKKNLALDVKVSRVFGKTLVCGNVIDVRNIRTAEATFESQVSGKVIIRGNEDGISVLVTNLYHIKSKITSRHDWKILTTDILDNRRHDDKCKYLQLLYDPNNIGDSDCKKTDHSKCPIGDLTKKHGQIQVAGLMKTARATYVDTNLPISSLDGSRSLFLVIYEVSSSFMNSTSKIISCAEITLVNARKVEATYNMGGVRGSIKISQRHYTEPATVSFDLFGLEGNTRFQSVRELPVAARTTYDNYKLCSNLGNIFDPHRNQRSNTGSTSTIDHIEVGNLSAKHDGLSVVDSEYEDHYMAEYIDLTIQLFGSSTVSGRSILIHKNNGDPWVCANLIYTDEPIRLAVAKFHYPVVGQIYFQQLANNPHSETGVLVDVYKPNGEKNSEGHSWAIHLSPSMADFYNWSQRCESVGEVYDPLQSTSGTADSYLRQCQSSMINEPLRCRLGDTNLKSGFKISLPISPSNRTRLYYTDPYLPLSHANSIIGRSVVIYDENSPKQRGNRLACSTIKTIHPLKASVRTWNSGPSIPSAVTGYMEFEQEMDNVPTKLKIDLAGFNGNVENFAIHQVWTMDDREFPCSNDSLYEIFDPYSNEVSVQAPPSTHYGSLATVDRVKVGDLSRKHGTFEGLQVYHKVLMDNNVPLFAPHSIIGRSVVLRAAVNDFRWVCGNIDLDYDKTQTRQIIGMASFDEPRSKVAGYVRFIQLEHKDGSLSDTFIQVDLRMQTTEAREFQSSNDHNWAVFVNQVGEDAFITADEVRCIAAGFKWNPFLSQDSSESYSISCNTKEHQACAMGDLGMRHGHLTLGPNDRRAFSDSNLPLTGNYSVIGRSLIIFDNKRPNVKLACANIMPDMHLKSNVVIKRMPSFTVARFVEQMRSLLGAAEWLMVPELKATKPVANGECVQMTIHFYGQRAHQMQIELNNLITLGTVSRSTRVGVDKISTHYKLCRTSQNQQLSSTDGLYKISSIQTWLGVALAIMIVIVMS